MIIAFSLFTRQVDKKHARSTLSLHSLRRTHLINNTTISSRKVSKREPTRIKQGNIPPRLLISQLTAKIRYWTRVSSRNTPLCRWETERIRHLISRITILCSTITTSALKSTSNRKVLFPSLTFNPSKIAPSKTLRMSSAIQTWGKVLPPSLSSERHTTHSPLHRLTKTTHRMMNCLPPLLLLCRKDICVRWQLIRT